MQDSPVNDDCVAALMAAAIGTIRSPILVTNYDTMLYVNDAGCRLLGATSKSQVYARSFPQLVHGDGQHAIAERRPLLIDWRQSLRGVPLKLQGVDGRVMAYRADIVPVDFDGQAAAMGLVDVVLPDGEPTDETDEPADVHQWARLFEAMPLCMLLHDEDRILAANAACWRVLGATSVQQLVGKPISSIVHSDGREAGNARRKIAAELGVRKFSRVPVKLLRLDGSDLRIEVDATILSLGEKTAFLVTSRAF